MRTLYWVAYLEVAACWVAFWAFYWFRAKRPRGRVPAATDRRAMRGLVLETVAIGACWFHLVIPIGVWRIVIAMLIAPLGAALFGWAVDHLGRQFRIQAGLWPDHRLVRSGPYGLVRHPIYLSLFLLMIATGLLNTTWWVLLSAVAIYITGTEIRIQAEERLLGSRFGAEFEEYRRKVPAYLPPVR